MNEKENEKHWGVTLREVLIYGVAYPALMLGICIFAEYINSL